MSEEAAILTWAGFFAIVAIAWQVVAITGSVATVPANILSFGCAAGCLILCWAVWPVKRSHGGMR